jgi:hypothetical protein
MLADWYSANAAMRDPVQTVHPPMQARTRIPYRGGCLLKEGIQALPCFPFPVPVEPTELRGAPEGTRPGEGEANRRYRSLGIRTEQRSRVGPGLSQRLVDVTYGRCTLET